MFENFGSKFLIGFFATSLLTIVIFLLMTFPDVFAVLAVFAVISFAVGSLLFRLGFKYNDEGDLVRETKKYDDC